jgi:hypothetical protein
MDCDIYFSISYLQILLLVTLRPLTQPLIIPSNPSSSNSVLVDLLIIYWDCWGFLTSLFHLIPLTTTRAMWHHLDHIPSSKVPEKLNDLGRSVLSKSGLSGYQICWIIDAVWIEYNSMLRDRSSSTVAKEIGKGCWHECYSNCGELICVGTLWWPVCVPPPVLTNLVFRIFTSKSTTPTAHITLLLGQQLVLSPLFGWFTCSSSLVSCLSLLVPGPSLLLPGPYPVPIHSQPISVSSPANPISSPSPHLSSSW